MSERTLEMTDKIKGKVMNSRQIKLSPDLKTLTMTVHAVGRSKPNILVFDREKKKWLASRVSLRFARSGL